MWGHALQINGLQLSLIVHVNEYFSRCQPPRYGPQPDWARVQQAHQADPVELAFPSTSSPFQVYWPLVMAGGAALILAALFAAPVAVTAFAAAGLVTVLFFDPWLATSFLEGAYQQTSYDLLTS
jgi:hypothetical protein